MAPEDVDGAMRSKTKAVSYGLAYGLSAFGLARQLRISQAEATALRDGSYETVLGTLGFNEKGDVKEPKYVMYVWKDGQYGEL